MRKLLLQSLFRQPLTEQAPRPDDAAIAELAATVGRTARRRLGRSLTIREVDAGSCNGCELEIHALSNPYYDVERFGIWFVASPRHADVLLVIGSTLATHSAYRLVRDMVEAGKPAILLNRGPTRADALLEHRIGFDCAQVMGQVVQNMLHT